MCLLGKCWILHLILCMSLIVRELIFHSSIKAYLVHWFFIILKSTRAKELTCFFVEQTSMATQQKTQAENPPKPAMSSCRKKTKDDANFLEDVKDHIDEFINASMDDHKNCFNKTIKKVSLPSLFPKNILDLDH